MHALPRVPCKCAKNPFKRTICGLCHIIFEPARKSGLKLKKKVQFMEAICLLKRDPLFKNLIYILNLTRHYVTFHAFAIFGCLLTNLGPDLFLFTFLRPWLAGKFKCQFLKKGIYLLIYLDKIYLD